MKLAFAVLLLSLTLAAQKPAPKYPHPFVQTSVSLNGTSESTLSLEGKAGVTIEEKHVLADTFAFYNTLKKNAPGIAQTSHGRKRAVGGDLFYHRKTWHYGVGAEFAEFAQTEYTKRSTFLFAGLGKDINDTARLRAMYLHAFNEQTRYPEGRGCQCTNGVQGIRFEAWLPNPARRHHWFFVGELTPIWFHTTVTDPSDAVLTARQKSEHSIDSGLKFSVMYRF